MARRNLINNAVQQANEVYENSADDTRYNKPHVTLVYKGEISYTESDMETNVNRLAGTSDGYMDEAHTLRTTHGADVVVLVTATGTGDLGGKGLAKQLRADVSTAFAVAKQEDLTYYTMTHEIGHLFGCRHDDASLADDWPYPYGRGFSYSPLNKQTVMSRKTAGSMPRIAFFSTPNHSEYNPYLQQWIPFGDATYRDNAKVHHVRAATVAAFKPTAIYASISGSSALPPKTWSTYSASVTGGSGTPSYQWYKKTTGSYSYVGSGTTYNLYMSPISDVWLKVIVTRGGSTDDVEKFVLNTGGGPFKKLPGLPDDYELNQNYPNPFNPSTDISFALPKQSNVSLRIFNVTGVEVQAWDMRNTFGYQSVRWNRTSNSGQSAAAGIYLYRLVARPTDGSATFVETRKMVLLK